MTLKSLEPVAEMTVAPILVQAATETLQQSGERIANEKNVSFEILNRIITDESGWDPTVVGFDGELGMAQIFLKYHPEVTIDQAKDPIYSLNFVANELANGTESAHTICNCRSEVSRLLAKLGTVLPKGEIIPNNLYPKVGGVIILQYGNLKHYAYVEKVGADGIHIAEANFIKCARSKRIIDFNDPHILGYWDDAI
jgi:hypothetical protein